MMHVTLESNAGVTKQTAIILDDIGKCSLFVDSPFKYEKRHPMKLAIRTITKKLI